MTNSLTGFAPPAEKAARSSTQIRFELIFFFGVLILLLSLSEDLLRDPDTHWHIAIGEHIWRTGQFPRTDEYSHTFAGAPWIAKEWLSQLFLYAAYSLAGWSGVTILTATTLATSFTLLAAWLMRRVKATVAISITLIALLLALGQFHARPHIFFFVLLVLWTGGLLNARERDTAPSWWLVAIIALWANLHASFTIAFVIAGFFGLEAIAHAPAPDRLRIAARWTAFGLASLAATGATPYGFEPLLITFKLFGGNEAVQYIDEWQPLKADGLGATAGVALVASLAILATSPRRNFFRILLVTFCGYLMVRYVRFGSLFGIVASMTAAGSVVRRFPALGPTPPSELGAKARTVYFALLLSCAGASALLAALKKPAPSPATTPVAALLAARNAGADGRVFNSYDFGGYLISQGVKTFVDGRSDQLFLGGFINAMQVAEKSEDESDLVALLDKYKVTWALVETKSRTRKKMEKLENWKEIHQDDVATAFIRVRADAGSEILR